MTQVIPSPEPSRTIGVTRVVSSKSPSITRVIHANHPAVITITNPPQMEVRIAKIVSTHHKQVALSTIDILCAKADCNLVIGTAIRHKFEAPSLTSQKVGRSRRFKSIKNPAKNISSMPARL